MDILLDDLFGGDSVMPAQFWATRARTQLNPLQRLQLAVLEDALRCVVNGQSAKSGKRLRLAWEAQLWLEGNWGDGPFSCEEVCESLHVDWSGLRKHVRAGVGAIPRRSANMASLMRVEEPDRRVR